MVVLRNRNKFWEIQCETSRGEQGTSHCHFTTPHKSAQPLTALSCQETAASFARTTCETWPRGTKHPTHWSCHHFPGPLHGTNGMFTYKTWLSSWKPPYKRWWPRTSRDHAVTKAIPPKWIRRFGRNSSPSWPVRIHPQAVSYLLVI